MGVHDHIRWARVSLGVPDLHVYGFIRQDVIHSGCLPLCAVGIPGEEEWVRERPCVAGVAGGVGVSLLAAGIGGVDHGVYRAHTPVAVLVCRSTVSSVGGAAHALQYTPARPVLAVVADIPGVAMGANTRNRLRATEPHAAGIVHVPVVAGWRDVPRTIRRAGELLAADPAELSKPERALARALGELVDAVLALPDPAVPPPGSEPGSGLREHLVPASSVGVDPVPPLLAQEG